MLTDIPSLYFFLYNKLYFLCLVTRPLYVSIPADIIHEICIYHIKTLSFDQKISPSRATVCAFSVIYLANYFPCLLTKTLETRN